MMSGPPGRPGRAPARRHAPRRRCSRRARASLHDLAQTVLVVHEQHLPRRQPVRPEIRGGSGSSSSSKCAVSSSGRCSGSAKPMVAPGTPQAAPSPGRAARRRGRRVGDRSSSSGCLRRASIRRAWIRRAARAPAPNPRDLSSRHAAPRRRCARRFPAAMRRSTSADTVRTSTIEKRPDIRSWHSRDSRGAVQRRALRHPLPETVGGVSIHTSLQVGQSLRIRRCAITPRRPRRSCRPPRRCPRAG